MHALIGKKLSFIVPVASKLKHFELFYNSNRPHFSSVYWHNNPGIANRTFGNRTQSNSIELNPWIEFDWVRQSNEIELPNLCEFDFQTNRTQSNTIQWIASPQ